MLFYSHNPQGRYELSAVCSAFNKHDITFSKATAAKLVGGRYQLEKLIKEGKIRAEKSDARQNGKWFCNGSDVLKNIRF